MEHSRAHPGDKGFSSLNKKKLSKDNLVFEAIGTLDELSALLGLARVIIKENFVDIVRIQKDLGKIMAEVVCFEGERLSTDDLEFLEHITAECEKKAGRIDKFFIPGQNKKEAVINLTRVVCRRAERRLVALKHEQKVSPFILVYLNRLSLLLFYWVVILSE